MERRQQHFSRTGAIVDLASIRSNMESLVKAARSVNPDIGLLATVKADAYGHGACEVANALAGTACMYSVACIDEGIELRTAGGIKAPILILGPVFAGDDEDTFRYGLTQTVFTLERAVQLNENAAVYDAERKADPDDIKARAKAEGDKAGEIVALLRENEQKQKGGQNGSEDPGFTAARTFISRSIPACPGSALHLMKTDSRYCARSVRCPTSAWMVYLRILPLRMKVINRKR